jgi:hypothetical protein
VARSPSPATGGCSSPLRHALRPGQLDADTTAAVLGAIATLLVLAGVAGQLSRFLLDHDHALGLVPLFHLDEEGNVPTYFSVGLMLGAAVLLARIARLKSTQRDQDAPRWAVLAIGFAAMAVDEGWSVHETLVEPMRGLLGGGRLGVLYFAWVVPGTLIVLAVGLYFLGFLRRLPGPTRSRFVLAAVLFLGGATGMELVGGYYAELHGRATLIYEALVAVEETLEMAGLIVLIHALMLHGSALSQRAEPDSRIPASGR